jgi:hypothetical protein
MLREKPYRYLRLPGNPLIDSWKDKIGNEEVFLYHDADCLLLKQDIRDLFLSTNLGPIVGNLWSWKMDTIPKFYHTDVTKNGVKFNGAINWLISGSPGITEWSYTALDTPVGEANSNHPFKKYGNTSSWWGSQDTPSDFSSVLDKPMLIKINVPHRVNTIGEVGHRISYSLRFKNNPDWETVLEKLSGFVDEN